MLLFEESPWTYPYQKLVKDNYNQEVCYRAYFKERDKSLASTFPTSRPQSPMPTMTGVYSDVRCLRIPK